MQAAASNSADGIGSALSPSAVAAVVGEHEGPYCASLCDLWSYLLCGNWEMCQVLVDMCITVILRMHQSPNCYFGGQIIAYHT